MPDLLAQGDQMLAAQRSAGNMSSPIGYSQAGAGPVTINATAGRTMQDVTTTQGVTVTSSVRDWIIVVADFVSAGLSTLNGGILSKPPSSSDRIIEANGTCWEVMAIGKGDIWSYAGNFDTQMRIHTKQVAPK